MAEVYQTISELEELFQRMIIDMLGLALGSPADYDAASYYVRIAWPAEGAPAWERTEDVCFIKVTEEDDPVNRQREERLTPQGGSPESLYLDKEISYTRVINLNLICYGPNSWENIQTIRDYIFEENPFRWALATDKIYPIPDMVAPRRMPEPFQNQYWERVDFDIRFNENIKKVVEVGTIGTVPIVLTDDNTRIEDVNFTVIED